jgi:hypothetical protein
MPPKSEWSSILRQLPRILPRGIPEPARWPRSGSPLHRVQAGPDLRRMRRGVHCGFAGHPEHCAHTYPELPRNATDAGSTGAR